LKGNLEKTGITKAGIAKLEDLFSKKKMMHDITSIETTCWYKKRLFDEFPTTFVAIEDFKEAIGKKLDKFFKVSRLITPGKRWDS
jgi:hypothetical protein